MRALLRGHVKVAISLEVWHSIDVVHSYDTPLYTIELKKELVRTQEQQTRRLA